ncbi:UDP-N-acetylmuramoyl-tripeptide--D-alanyl-D-alanine ligase [Flavobacterium sp. xlx-214]|uniref:UDP-N-acetylmuramoyl-tripeptide--D-alanyl-D- alanine ligase n=1 Tax=unclassified Flavobacterium TaxID=196869 RepID=UPI0013D59704|nr:MULTISPECIES: UDP-N-acetylmuramoyl-tripeptide--D-alanyl-D-alanine ligase [unclassified Flavobacterium]MBA5791181.1 UDP-N-acetylmuramoyl-tripeptide--D-alanyl-D-alanine ligase [Flavobacterium sp. xlx-221]QMI83649.1 UDP-N-acetylmuramoyl-tripeptide--D-alanyl-D-alanine ligase [Flavobacterium sp. xlx-214]
MEIHELYKLYSGCNGVSTDTRKIEENSMFFALKGEHFDANDFALQALEKGAAYAVVDNKALKKLENNRLIFVSDVLECLQELASYHRFHIGLPLIALTGSNGKTTSKELLFTVLQKHYNTIATIGNLNNHIGVPLTLLRLTDETDLGIIEMGANHQGEIEDLCKIADPDFGYITNFGLAHLEGFGGFEGVVKGKSEMYTFIKEQSKQVFVNFDDPLQVEKTKNMKRFGFSMQNNSLANVQISNALAQPMASLTVQNITIQSNLTGVYNIPNIAFAITAGLFFNIPIQTIKEAIESYVPQNNRSQWTELNSNKILLDAYNANPSSMQVAIQNFNQLQEDNKIMILGDMFELGNESTKEHKHIIEEANKTKIKTIFIGDHFYESKLDCENATYFKTLEDFTKTISKNTLTHSVLLIKGSRGMALERILEFI